MFSTLLINRFWDKVSVFGEDDCWEWKAGRTGNHYGSFSISHKQQIGAHQFSWMIHFGEIPEGMFVCHHCDNPPCVNPKHLFLGTAQTNMDDKHAKGREVYEKGSQRWSAKLTEDEVQSIRERVSRGELQKNLANEFNVAKSTVSMIVTGKNWRG